MFENLIKKKVKNFLENDLGNVLNDIPDETICNLFDKAKNSIIELRHIKEENLALRAENEELKRKLNTAQNINR
jgi:regulator of replication initiation timing